MNIIEKLKRKTISDFLYESVHKVDSSLAKKRKFTDKFTFVNNSNGAENLLLVIAGFQPYYWDAVFERVKENQANFSEDIDVCIIEDEFLSIFNCVYSSAVKLILPSSLATIEA